MRFSKFYPDFPHSAVRGIISFIIKPFGAVLLVLLLVSCGPDEKDKIPGDIRNFDPIARLPEILGEWDEGDYFLDVSSNYVRPDGTIDVKANYIRPTDRVTTYTLVRYTADDPFEPPEPRKKDSSPLGVGAPPEPEPEGSPTYTWYEIQVHRPGKAIESTTSGGGTSSYAVWYHGIKRRSFALDEENSISYEERVQPPSVSYGEIWRKAVEAGAPSENAVASIDYNQEGYHFKINMTDYSYDFDLQGRMYDPDLYRAAEAGDTDTVRKMLEEGLSPDSRNDQYIKEDGTGLMIAAEKGYADIVYLLLEYGCRIDLRDKEYSTALMYAAWAASRTGPETLIKLLDAGAQMNLQDYYLDTALHIAAYADDPEAIKILLDAEADPSIRNDRNHTVYMHAKKNVRRVAYLALEAAGVTE